MKLKLTIITLLLIILPIKNIYAEKLAVLPFSQKQGISDRDYKHIFKAFLDKVSGFPQFEVMDLKKIFSIFKEHEIDQKDFKSLQDISRIGKLLEVDLLIIGNLGLKNSNNHTVYTIELLLMDVKRNITLNHLSWTYNVSGNILHLAESAALKLLWLNRDLYPLSVNLYSDRKKKTPLPSMRKLIRYKIKNFKLNKYCEVVAVDAIINEKKGISTLGCIGCITLVGWLFLPSDEIKTHVEVNIKVQYLTKQGIKNRSFYKSYKKTESFNIFRSENKKFANTFRLLERTINEIEKEIKLKIPAAGSNREL